MEDPDFVYKIVLLGESGVGKTSLVQRYVYDSLSPEMAQTIGAVLHVKTIPLEDANYKLIIWDLGGQESFRQLREQYCANASGAFFVFDRGRPETLGSIDRWMESLYASAGEVPVVVIENKIDLDPVFDAKDIQAEIDNRRLALMQTSATESMNVNQTFEGLVRTIRGARS
ncbi:MAG: Rab family GTPase [Candidatus Thorarchaeota archaeon]